MSRSPGRERKIQEEPRKPKQRSAKEGEASTAPVDPFPSRMELERMMRDIGLPKRRKPRKDAAWEAQELAYKAMQAESPEEAIVLAGRALELDEGCIDALMLIATIASGGEVEKAVELFAAVVEISRKRLGEKFFKENEGDFWGLLETRPYMRAHAGLAQMLVECGRVDEAIGHYEELLKLNPNDNQGLRYELLSCYLQGKKLEEASELLRKYEAEGFAIFLWGRVLHKILSGDLDGAGKELVKARKQNAHVEALLNGTKKMPRELPGYHGFGDKNEAVYCVDILGPAWKTHLAAIVWLRAQSIPRVRKAKAAPKLRLRKED